MIDDNSDPSQRLLNTNQPHESSNVNYNNLPAKVKYKRSRKSNGTDDTSDSSDSLSDCDKVLLIKGNRSVFVVYKVSNYYSLNQGFRIAFLAGFSYYLLPPGGTLRITGSR